MTLRSAPGYLVILEPASSRHSLSAHLIEDHLATRIPAARAGPLRARLCPYDSLKFTLSSNLASIGYGRPSTKGRTVFGVLVAFDTLWRAGANEPTIVHLPFAAEIAGVKVEPGSYSLYVFPNSTQCTHVVNGSTGQWGIESAYNDVRGDEIARAYTAQSLARGRRLVRIGSTRTVRTGHLR